MAITVEPGPDAPETEKKSYKQRMKEKAAKTKAELTAKVQRIESERDAEAQNHKRAQRAYTQLLAAEQERVELEAEVADVLPSRWSLPTACSS